MNLNELPAEEQQDKTNEATQSEHGSQMQIPRYFKDYYDEAPATVYAHADQSKPTVMVTEAHGSRAMEPIALSSKLSHNTTPYTWSESACRDYERRPSSENCTKSTSCVDLNHQHINDEEKANKRYWDLD